MRRRHYRTGIVITAIIAQLALIAGLLIATNDFMTHRCGYRIDEGSIFPPPESWDESDFFHQFWVCSFRDQGDENEISALKSDLEFRWALDELLFVVPPYCESYTELANNRSLRRERIEKVWAQERVEQMLEIQDEYLFDPVCTNSSILGAESYADVLVNEYQGILIKGDIAFVLVRAKRRNSQYYRMGEMTPLEDSMVDRDGDSQYKIYMKKDSDGWKFLLEPRGAPSLRWEPNFLGWLENGSYWY